MTYRNRMLPLAVVVAVGTAVAVAGGTEAITAAPDEAAGASVMFHPADRTFSAGEKEKLREICGLGAPSGRYRSTIICNSAEAADPKVRAIIKAAGERLGSANDQATAATDGFNIVYESSGRTASTTRGLESEGSFFTPAEQAVINQKCGYAPGEWDGMDMNISHDVFRCRNGKRVHDPEMQFLLRAAQPRIERRLELATGRPEGGRFRR